MSTSPSQATSGKIPWSLSSPSDDGDDEVSRIERGADNLAQRQLKLHALDYRLSVKFLEQLSSGSVSSMEKANSIFQELHLSPPMHSSATPAATGCCQLGIIQAALAGDVEKWKKIRETAEKRGCHTPLMDKNPIQLLARDYLESFALQQRTSSNGHNTLPAYLVLVESQGPLARLQEETELPSFEHDVKVALAEQIFKDLLKDTERTLSAVTQQRAARRPQRE